MWSCRACAAHRDEIAHLRAELAAERVERAKLMDRCMALSQPLALAQVRQAATPPVMSADESGTTVRVNGQDIPVARFTPDGEPLLEFEPGRLLRPEEWSREMDRVHRILDAGLNGNAPNFSDDELEGGGDG